MSMTFYLDEVPNTYGFDSSAEYVVNAFRDDSFDTDDYVCLGKYADVVDEYGEYDVAVIDNDEHIIWLNDFVN